MSAEMNETPPAEAPIQPSTPERSDKRRFAPPPQSAISDKNFEPETEPEPYESYGRKPQKTKKGIGGKILITLLIIVVLAAIGAGVYELFLKPKSVVHAPAATQPAPAKTTVAVTTKHYDSTNFSLGIDYPQDWVVADTSGAKMTVTSPVLSLPAASGSSQNGEVVLTIQNKQTSLPDFAKGNATAVLNSDNVNYTKPTANQRASTYLSYLQYAATTTSGAIDGIYITGNNGYQKGQDVPQADIIGVDPLVTVTFVTCADNACATPKPLSLDATAYQKSAEAAPVKAMLQSLTFN